MKHNGLLIVMIANVATWITTGVVAGIAIRTTGNAWWSLIMLIPALCGYNYSRHED